MALFHTTVVDNQIKALDTIGTSSGSIATFDTDRAERLINLEVAITATGGGGTPVSPIAINGFSACNLSVNGTTETISFGQTVYGGRLNVGSGVLTVTWIDVDLGTLAWTVYNASNHIFAVSVTGKANGVDNLLCEQYANYTGALNNMPDLSIRGQGSANILYIRNTNCTTDTDIITALSGVKCIYELATPTTIQLDSKQIQTIANSVNNIYADTGDIIDLKFVLSVGKAIS